jgi:hypothetical protein
MDRYGFSTQKRCLKPLSASPCGVEARYATKRSMSWVGYKVHLTESGDEGLPHLITDVHTTAATATDVKQLTPIQRRLAANGGCPPSNWRTPPTSVAATSFLATSTRRSTSSAQPSRTTPGAGQSRRRLRRGKLLHRLEKEDGELSPGAPEHPLVGNQDCSGAKYDPHRFLPRRLQRMPESIFVHASQGSTGHFRLFIR